MSENSMLLRLLLPNTDENHSVTGSEHKKGSAIKPILDLNLKPYAPAKRPTRQLDFIETEKPSRPRRCKSSVTKRLDST